MNKAFEKIIERFEELHERYVNQYGVVGGNPVAFAVKECKYIVQEVAEEFATDTNVGTNGWIPCSYRLPEEYGEYLVWWTDITRSQYYEIVEYEPSNGWIGDIPQAVEGKYSVIAWQPLPEPYKERD